MATTKIDLLTSARTKLVEAQVLGQEFDNRMAESLAITSELATRREVIKGEWDAAAPSLHRIFTFNFPITAESSAALTDTLSRWDRIDSDKGRSDGYKIVLCSPGGEITAGFQAYSFLKGLAERRPLTIVASGLCASMATVLHQAASEGQRIIEPGCTYLLHELSSGVVGRLDSIQDTTKFLQKLNEGLHAIYAERGAFTAEEYGEKIARRETYLSPEEVLEWGLADEMRYASI